MARGRSKLSLGEFDLEGYLDNEALEATKSDSVDYPEDRVMIDYPAEEEPEEEVYELTEDNEDYTEEEVDAFMEKVDLSNDGNEVSFDQMMPKKKEKTGILVQRKERKINPFLILREVVTLTPSVCDNPSCKYDAAKAAGFSSWNKVPEKRKSLVKQILEKHREEKHRFMDQTIVDESELPSSWLSRGGDQL